MTDETMEHEPVDGETADETAAETAEETAAETAQVPTAQGDDSAEPSLGAPSIEAALEALLLLADEPVPVVRLAQVVGVPTAQVEEALPRLVADYSAQGRGFDLREVAGGWRFYTSAACSEVVERWVLDGQQARLTQAALETLAVVAYRQPVSRARISAVRGVNVDGVVRTLQARGLIEEAGHDDSTGAILYRTTSYFLERMGIAAIDDLPPLADHLPGLDELEDVLDAVATGE